MSEEQYYALLAFIALYFGGRKVWARRRAASAGHDAQMLARTLWAETSGLPKHSDRELAAICYVAINRADGGFSLEEVLQPPGRSDYGVWNASGRFRQRWEEAPTYRAYTRCLEVAERVLAGEVPNQIGNRALFYHPGGLPRCAEGEDLGPKRVCTRTSKGWRGVPVWDLQNPIQIGEAVFCGEP